MSVSVCLSVCPFMCLENDMLKLRKIFFTHYLWLWLDSSLTTVKNVMYFQFCG